MSTPKPPAVGGGNGFAMLALSVLRKVLKYPLLTLLEVARQRIERWRRGPGV